MKLRKKIISVFRIQDEIKKRLASKDKDVEINKLARDLGCALDSKIDANGKHYTNEVVKRIQEAARTYRESYLWIFAFVSAITSLISALAAWCAVLISKQNL